MTSHPKLSGSPVGRGGGGGEGVHFTLKGLSALQVLSHVLWRSPFAGMSARSCFCVPSLPPSSEGYPAGWESVNLVTLPSRF